jgi:single-stranded DNA-specific DHH superfamily exonuclease
MAHSTVAEMVPLTGDNRIFVKGGFDLINSGPIPGIRSRIELIVFQDHFINSEDIL